MPESGDISFIRLFQVDEQRQSVNGPVIQPRPELTSQQSTPSAPVEHCLQVDSSLSTCLQNSKLSLHNFLDTSGKDFSGLSLSCQLSTILFLRRKLKGCCHCHLGPDHLPPLSTRTCQAVSGRHSSSPTCSSRKCTHQTGNAVISSSSSLLPSA